MAAKNKCFGGIVVESLGLINSFNGARENSLLLGWSESIHILYSALRVWGWKWQPSKRCGVSSRGKPIAPRRDSKIEIGTCKSAIKLEVASKW